MKEITRNNLIETMVGLPFKDVELVRAALILLHLERANWCRTKASKTSGLSIRCIRDWVRRFVKLGIEDKMVLPEPSKRKKPEVYKERVFVSYEFKNR